MANNSGDGLPGGSPGVQLVFTALIQNLKSKEEELRASKQQVKQLQTENTSLRKISISSMKSTGSVDLTIGSGSSSCVTRSDSADSRRKSNPEIFLFPDTSQHVTAQPAVTEVHQVQPEPLVPQTQQGQTTMSLPATGEKNFMTCVGSPGVSEHYFQTVVSELVKTKLMLQALQRQQDVSNNEATELSKMTQEIQGLRFQNQNLKRDLMVLQESQRRTDGVVREDSFELDDTNKEQLTTREAETQTQMDIMLDTESIRNMELIKTLRAEIDKLRKQNNDLEDERRTFTHDFNRLKHDSEAKMCDYDHLKGSVKIISTCLKEEKSRTQSLEKKLQLKGADVKKLTEQIGNLRQKYEELLGEKRALEKEASLHDAHNSSTYQSPAQPGANPLSQYRSDPGMRLGQQHHFNIMPETWQSPGHGSGPPAVSRRRQLEPSARQISVERAPTNLSLLGSSSPVASGVGYIETQDHDLYTCPTCDQAFQIEESYLKHLNKCIE